MSEPTQPSRTFWRNFIAVFLVAVSLGSFYLCIRTLRTVERMVTVIENLDRKVDRVANSPALDRAQAAMSAAQEKGVKQAAKDEARRLMDDWLAKQKAKE